jgi:hypothetical protein
MDPNDVCTSKQLVENWQLNRVIRKVRKTQHHNPEFGHTQREIQKTTCKQVH